MKKFNVLMIVLTALFLLSTTAIFFIDPESKDVVMSKIAFMGINGSFLLMLSFLALRLRDYLLGVKFPINLINENPVASSIYYGVSVFAFIIGIAIIS